MGIDVTIQKCLQSLARSIGCIGGEAFGFEIKAAHHALDHCYTNPVLLNTVSTCALGINDDAQLVVDQVIGVIDKDRPDLLLFVAQVACGSVKDIAFVGFTLLLPLVSSGAA